MNTQENGRRIRGVVGGALALLLVSCGAETPVAQYSVSGTVTGLGAGQSVVLQNNGGDDLLVSADGSFTFSTPVSDGDTYSVTVATQPGNERCLAPGASGTVQSAPVTGLTVTCAAPRYAYVASMRQSAISIFAVDAATGQLRGQGSVGTGGSGPIDIAVDPQGRFAYVSNAWTQDISAYRIDATSGALTLVGRFTFGVGAVQTDMVIDSTGQFVYVLNHSTVSGTVMTLRIDAATGALTRMGEVEVGSAADDIVMAPSGRVLYVWFSGGSLRGFRIDAATGALTSLGMMMEVTPVWVSSAPAFDPSGRFAYAAGRESYTASPALFIYRVDEVTGVLTRINSIPSANPDEAAWSAVVDPSGQFVYVMQVPVISSVPALPCRIAVYRMNPVSGSLTSVGSGVEAPRQNICPMTVDPSGQFLYVLDGNLSEVWAFRIDTATGLLTRAGNVAIWETPGSMAILGGTAPVVFQPRSAYVVNSGSNDLSAYSIDAVSGALTSLGTVAAGTAPNAVVIDPQGRFAYAANQGSSDVSAYRIDPATGALTGLGIALTTVTPPRLAMGVMGKLLYSENASSMVMAYAIDAATGGLVWTSFSDHFPWALDSLGHFAYTVDTTNRVRGCEIPAGFAYVYCYPSPTITAGTAPVAITTEASGRFAYVANSGSNDVSAYRAGAFGILTDVGPAVAAGTTPTAITADPLGRYIYVVNSGSGDIWAYRIDPFTGALTGLGVVATGTAVAIDITGRFAYVTDAASNTITAYRLNAADSAFTFIGTLPTGTTPVSVSLWGSQG